MYNQSYIWRRNACRLLVGKSTQTEQSDDIGIETVKAWVGLIYLTVSIGERLFWMCWRTLMVFKSVHGQTIISNKMHIWRHTMHWNTAHFVGYCTLLQVNEHLRSKKCMEFDQLMKSRTSIFQLNAHYIKYIYLLNTSYVFWCAFHHSGREHCYLVN